MFFLQDCIYCYLFLVSNALSRYCIVMCIFPAHILCTKAWASACLILLESFTCLNVLTVQWFTNVGVLTGNRMEWQETVLFFCFVFLFFVVVTTLSLAQRSPACSTCLVLPRPFQILQSQDMFTFVHISLWSVRIRQDGVTQY